MSDVRLILGDCLQVLPMLESGSVDAVVTDPPYGKQFHDGGISGRASDKWASPNKAKFQGQSIIGDSKPDTRAIVEIARVLRQGGAAYFCSQWMTESAWMEAAKAAGLKIRNRLVWAKPFHGAGDLITIYGPQHETIIYTSKGRHELRGRRDGDVWLEPIGANGCFRKDQQHPNQKPLALMTWLIEKSSNPGETILDPFMGSGTTGVACVQTGRNFIGIEICEEYYEIACRRIEAAQNACPLFDPPQEVCRQSLLFP